MKLQSQFLRRLPAHRHPPQKNFKIIHHRADRRINRQRQPHRSNHRGRRKHARGRGGRRLRPERDGQISRLCPRDGPLRQQPHGTGHARRHRMSANAIREIVYGRRDCLTFIHFSVIIGKIIFRTFNPRKKDGRRIRGNARAHGGRRLENDET